MSREFVRANTQFLSVDSAPITGAPLSFGCFAKPNNGSNVMGLFWIGDKDQPSQYWALKTYPASDRIKYTPRAGSSELFLVTTTQFNVGAWNHVLAVSAAANDHRVYVNGGGKGTSSATRAPANADRVALGRMMDSTPSEAFDGGIAEAAIWNAALTDDEAVRLAAGWSPKLVRPDALVFYAPILGRRSPEIDLVGGRMLTLGGGTGTPSYSADHPRMIRPAPILVPLAPTVAALGGPPRGSLALMGIGR